MRSNSVAVTLLLFLALFWPIGTAVGDDDNRLLNLEDASGMFNERGYLKSNSFSLDGNEVVNDFNGNLIYTQRLMYLPLSENGLHCDFKLIYNGNVSHTAFGYHKGTNNLDQTPINLPEWILSINGIAVQTFNFENELITWCPGANDSISEDDDVAAHIEGYHKCYRISQGQTGITHGTISILMEDGSVREYYTLAGGLDGPFNMKAGEYHSFSKDDTDKGYLWPIGTAKYGYFTLFRSDGTQVHFKIYKPKYRTDIDCLESFQGTNDDYPKILLPERFEDQMGHSIDLTYLYETDSHPIWGRPILLSAGDFSLSWGSWDQLFQSSNDVSLIRNGSTVSSIYFASQPPERSIIAAHSVSLAYEANRGYVFSIEQASLRTTDFTYRSYSRIYNNLKMGVNPAQHRFNVCNSAERKFAGGLYRLQPWRIWRIKSPDGGLSIFHYYNDRATAWGQQANLGPVDQLIVDYDHSENCLLDQHYRFPCKKTDEFDEIGRDPFFLNMVTTVRRTLGDFSIINTDSLAFGWEDELGNQVVDIQDRFVTFRYFGKDSLDDIESDTPCKRRTITYGYYPERGPISTSSRDRGWSLKMLKSDESGRPLDNWVVKKTYFWNTGNCEGVCDGTLLLDSLKSTYNNQSTTERYRYTWLGDPALMTTNIPTSKVTVDPWQITTTYFDTSYVRLDNPNSSYYNCQLEAFSVSSDVSSKPLAAARYQYFGASASAGFVGQLSRSTRYLIDESGYTTDSVYEESAFLKNAVPASKYYGSTMWHCDAEKDTTYFYYPHESEVTTYKLQAHDGSVDTITQSIAFTDSGPYWFKRESRVASRSLVSFQNIDSRGRLSWTIEPNGFRSELSYDNLDRVQNVRLPGGYKPTSKASSDTAWSLMYLYDDDPTPDPISVTQRTRVGKYEPSLVNRVWFDGLSRAYRHDVISAGGSYDSTLAEFDYAGRTTRQFDQLGIATDFEYDFLDRKTKTIYPDPTHSTYKTRYWVTNADSLGLTARFWFPVKAIFAQEHEDENGNLVREFYDSRNKLRLSQSYNGQAPLSTYFDYDALGNLTLVIRPKGDSVRYFYNSLGQIVEEQCADYAGHGDTLRYASINYKYDKNGNMIERLDPVLNYNLGGLYHMRRYNDYDNLNRLTESGVSYVFAGVPQRAPRQRYFYDQSSSELSLGRLSVAYTVDPNGICNYAERYHYDPRGRIKRQVNFFNAALDSVPIAGTNEFSYTISGDSVVISYGYDWSDKLTSITYPDGSVVKYYYDSRGRLTSVGGSAEAEASKYAQLSYTRRNELETLNLGDHLQQIDYLYNERGWLESINDGVSSSAGVPEDLFGQKLYYGSHPNAPSGWEPQFNGNLVGQKISTMGGSFTFAYKYDESNRLVDTRRGSSAFETFAYDENGNIAQRSRMTTDGWITYDNVYYSLTNKLQIVDRAHYLVDDTLTYDRNGNLIYDSGKKASMVYDPYDRLIMTRVATDLGADTILYGYNASGVRIYKAFRHHYRARCYDPTIKEGDDPDPDPEPIPLWCIFSRTDITYYDLAGEKILRERTTGVQLDKSSNYIYSGNNRIAMRDEQNRLHYFLTDHLGSTRVVIDSTGLVEDKYWYFCYGGTWNEEVSLNQPYRYTAKPLDSEAGLNIYYYGARYYDADLGRFLALDPAASKYPSLSPYAYCANNPLKSVDPDGNAVETVIDAASVCFSAVDMWNEPSWKNLGLLALDVGSLVVPFVPAVGTVRHAGKLGELAHALLGGEKAAEVAKDVDRLTDIATDAEKAVGGTGAVAGTAKHSKMANEIRKSGDTGLVAEQSYKGGKPVGYGTEGSTRLDAARLDGNGKPMAAYDLKTGSAKLTTNRVEAIRRATNDPNLPVIEIRPKPLD